MVKYPIGKQDFKCIREEDNVYIDKTSFIPKLFISGKYYFLSRPRRFGKSLFLSTLEYFFLGERQLFKNLYIDSYDWDWLTYPVVRLDLNGGDYTINSESLTNKLSEQLSHIEKRYGIESIQSDPGLRFENLIINLAEKTGRQVVVLIDEYEKPVLDTIDNPTLSNRHRESLRGFYSVLKSLDRHLKLVFITGVTRIGKMSVFSALNNLRDISMDSEFADICGITEKELLTDLQPGITKLAEKEGTDFEGALQLLKENYDGYHFCAECPDIYNPFSLLNALTVSEIRAYWSMTGTPNVLAKLLIDQNYDFNELEGVKATQETLVDLGGQFDDPIALFYQTGYLTIKGYNPTMKVYTLGFPNREVEVAFCNFLMPYFMKSKSRKPETFVLDFAEGILNGDPEKSMRALESFCSTINYDLVPAPEVERHFQMIIYIFSRLILPYTSGVKTEERTSDGRIDMIITTSRFVYIIEIKRNNSAEAAIRQIREKEYALGYMSDARKVFIIGVNFSTEKRRLEDFKIETLSKS